MLSVPIGLVSVFACLLVVVGAWISLKRRDIIAYLFGFAGWLFTYPIMRPLCEWLID